MDPPTAGVDHDGCAQVGGHRRATRAATRGAVAVAGATCRDQAEDPHVGFVLDAEGPLVDVDLVVGEGDPRHDAQEGESAVVEVLEPEQHVLGVSGTFLTRGGSCSQHGDAPHLRETRDAVGDLEGLVVLHGDRAESACFKFHL